jgi:thiol-disulfide isomerase/thioredoxin
MNRHTPNTTSGLFFAQAAFPRAAWRGETLPPATHESLSGHARSPHPTASVTGSPSSLAIPAGRRWYRDRRLAAAVLLTALMLGCGRSSTPDQVVAPDAPATSGDAAVTATPSPAAGSTARSPGEPPGTLEMPADFNPQDPGRLTPPPAAGSPAGGFSMPTQPEGVQAPEVDPTPSPGPGAAVLAPAGSGDIASGHISLRAAPWDQITQAITSTGRITVVDVWSLACEPCLKEFPGLVAIHRDMGDRVACFSVNVDFDGRKTKPAESYRPRVEEFLASADAGFVNFLSQTASDDLFAEIEIQSIPAVLIYDAQGKLIRTFSDVGADAGFTYAENILPFLTQLLAQNS